MNSLICRRLATLERAVKFVVDHPVDNALVATFHAQLQTHIATIGALAAGQTGARAAMLGAAQRRQAAAEELRQAMRRLSRIAKVLDRREYPDLAIHLRTANLKVYPVLLTRARNVVEVTRPHQDVFIAYGAAPDFIAELETLIARVDLAGDDKGSDRGNWVGKTAALEFETRAAIRTMRKLEAILLNVHRADPGLLAATSSATHIERRSGAGLADSRRWREASDGQEVVDRCGRGSRWGDGVREPAAASATITAASATPTPAEPAGRATMESSGGLGR